MIEWFWFGHSGLSKFGGFKRFLALKIFFLATLKKCFNLANDFPITRIMISKGMVSKGQYSKFGTVKGFQYSF